MKRFVCLVVFLLVLAALPVSANQARVAGLGLIVGDSDWIAPDMTYAVMNPAYLSQYAGQVELNALDATGASPYGQVALKLGKSLTLGIAAGYPVMSGPDLRQDLTGTLAGNIRNAYLRTGSSAGFLAYTAYTPIQNSAFATAAGTPAAVFGAATAPGMTFDRVRIGAALDLGENARAGLAIHYAGSTYSLSSPLAGAPGAPVNATQHTLSMTELGFDAGINLAKFGPFKEFAGGLQLYLPGMERREAATYGAAPAHINYAAINTDGALTFGLNVTGTFDAGDKNALVVRVQFLSENNSLKQTLLDDVNGNGNTVEAGDTSVTDLAKRTCTSFVIGLADRYEIAKGSFLFAGAYLKSASHDIGISGSRNDNTGNGPNYSNPYDVTVSELQLPVVLGGEFALASWLTARCAVSRNVVGKLTEEARNNTYTAYTSTVLTTQTIVNTFSGEGATAFSTGLTLAVAGFTLDWVLNLRWIGLGGASLGTTDNATGVNLSTQFSMSWKFGGADDGGAAGPKGK